MFPVSFIWLFKKEVMNIIQDIFFLFKKMDS